MESFRNAKMTLPKKEVVFYNFLREWKGTDCPEDWTVSNWNKLWRTHSVCSEWWVECYNMEEAGQHPRERKSMREIMTKGCNPESQLHKHNYCIRPNTHTHVFVEKMRGVRCEKWADISLLNLMTNTVLIELMRLCYLHYQCYEWGGRDNTLCHMTRASFIIIWSANRWIWEDFFLCGTCTKQYYDNDLSQLLF